MARLHRPGEVEAVAGQGEEPAPAVDLDRASPGPVLPMRAPRTTIRTPVPLGEASAYAARRSTMARAASVSRRSRDPGRIEVDAPRTGLRRSGRSPPRPAVRGHALERSSNEPHVAAAATLAFRRGRVHRHLGPIPVAPYRAPGDPLRRSAAGPRDLVRPNAQPVGCSDHYRSPHPTVLVVPSGSDRGLPRAVARARAVRRRSDGRGVRECALTGGEATPDATAMSRSSARERAQAGGGEASASPSETRSPLIRGCPWFVHSACPWVRETPATGPAKGVLGVTRRPKGGSSRRWCSPGPMDLALPAERVVGVTCDARVTGAWATPAVSVSSLGR
jgi:hypothetical protein